MIKLLINAPNAGFWNMGINNFSKKNLEINANCWKRLNKLNFLLINEKIILQMHFIE